MIIRTKFLNKKILRIESKIFKKLPRNVDLFEIDSSRFVEY